MKELVLVLVIFVGFTAVSRVQAVDLNDLCDGLLFNAIPHPSDNNLFIGCIEEKGTVFGCEADNLIFDPNTVKCVDPKWTTTATKSPTTVSTTKSSATSQTTTTTRRSGNINISFSCPPSGVGFIPHKTDCTRYYECIRGIASPRTCETVGYHYDLAYKMCQPADMAICANTIRCS
ncbi:uncharacterized protein [Chironomus tepperi]|uniref:uncharacterized protein n=1 Tax=Chironomus tepperi TaxID=113505 RepID=UPI00391F5965